MEDPDPARRLEWLDLEPQPVRAYPNEGGAPGTTLASQLLGFTNREGEGQYGIEQRFQDLLGGRPRVLTAQRDVSGRVIADTERLVDAGVPGSDIRLTIDASLQLQLEKELYAAWVADKAKMVIGVVMDPVHRRRSWPGPACPATTPTTTADGRRGSLDPHRPGRQPGLRAGLGDEDVRRRRRPTTGASTPQARSSTTRRRSRFGTEKVSNSDHRGMGPITFEDVIAYSRNIVAARVRADARARRSAAAAASLYDMWDAWASGARPASRRPARSAGLVVDPATRPWAGIDLANRAFGQGVAVTQLQLAQAFAAMVNGGQFVRPRLVADLAGQPVEAVPPDAGPRRARLDRAARADDPRRDRGALVREGTLIPGYAVGGKTGTAQIWDSSRGRVDAQHLQLQLRRLRRRRRGPPAAVVAVRIGQAKPRVAGQGVLQLKITSYELFRRVARRHHRHAWHPAPGQRGPVPTASE